MNKKRFEISLPEDSLHWLKQYAQAEGSTVTAYMRGVLVAHVKGRLYADKRPGGLTAMIHGLMDGSVKIEDIA